MQEWMNELPEELKGNETLGQYKSLDEALKGFVETKSMLGNSIRIPSEHAGEEDRKAFLEKLTTKVPELMKRPDYEDAEFWATFGTPSDPSGYAIPEGVELPDGSEEGLREIFLKAKLSKQQAEDMMKEMSARGSAIAGEQAVAAEAAEKALRAEWGAAYEERMKTIGALESKFDLSTPQGRYEIAKALFSGEAEVAGQGEGQSGAMTPAEAQARIDEIYANPKSAFRDKSHPGHRRAMDEMVKLVALANPGQSTDPMSLRRTG